MTSLRLASQGCVVGCYADVSAHKELSTGGAHFRHSVSSLLDNYSSEVSRLFDQCSCSLFSGNP